MNDIINQYEDFVKGSLMMRMKTVTMIKSATMSLDPRLQTILSEVKSKDSFDVLINYLREVNIDDMENQTTVKESI